MPNLYLEKIFYESLPDLPRRSPRERFVKYYSDLHATENLAVAESESFMQGGQYSFAQLGDKMLQKLQTEKLLEQLNLFVLTHWSHEFDPDVACGAYFCERYKLPSVSFDVIDQGILAPFSAIKVIQAYLQHENYSRALLLTIDQTTIPKVKEQKAVYPSLTSCAALLFSKEFDRQAIEIISIQLVQTTKLAQILNLLNMQYNRSQEALELFVNSDLKNFSRVRFGLVQKFKKMTRIDLRRNCAEWITLLKEISDRQLITSQHFVLISQDVESTDWALILCKQPA